MNNLDQQLWSAVDPFKCQRQHQRYIAASINDGVFARSAECDKSIVLAAKFDRCVTRCCTCFLR